MIIIGHFFMIFSNFEQISRYNQGFLPVLPFFRERIRPPREISVRRGRSVRAAMVRAQVTGGEGGILGTDIFAPTDDCFSLFFTNYPIMQ